VRSTSGFPDRSAREGKDTRIMTGQRMPDSLEGGLGKELKLIKSQKNKLRVHQTPVFNS
jgi:hypothetical protein